VLQLRVAATAEADAEIDAIHGFETAAQLQHAQPGMKHHFLALGLPQLLQRPFRVARLAEDLAIKQRALIRADDQGFGFPHGDGPGLLAGQALHIVHGLLAGSKALVDIRRLAAEGQMKALQQFPAKGRAGGQDKRGFGHEGQAIETKQQYIILFLFAKPCIVPKQAIQAWTLVAETG